MSAREGRYTPFGPVAQLNVSGIVQCDDCGAIVADVGVHDRYHSILNGHAWALAVLKTAHIAPRVHAKFDVVERMDSKKFDSWTNDALAEVMAQLGDEVKP